MLSVVITVGVSALKTQSWPGVSSHMNLSKLQEFIFNLLNGLFSWYILSQLPYTAGKSLMCKPPPSLRQLCVYWSLLLSVSISGPGGRRSVSLKCVCVCVWRLIRYSSSPPQQTVASHGEMPQWGSEFWASATLYNGNEHDTLYSALKLKQNCAETGASINPTINRYE